MTGGGVTPASRAAERAARDAYGRLVAILAARSRDVAAAEDALAQAFRIALETWPERGVPDNPEAWLLTVARRELGHAARHAGVVRDAIPTLELLAGGPDEGDTMPIPDQRLALLFVCAHPAIDPAMQAPLMLQTVLGLDAARIASSFLTSPTAMGQRLVRAKAKIRDSGVPFEVPAKDEWPARVDAVLSAVYAAYGTGWEDVLGADPRRKGLAEEAIWMARMVSALMPDDPEAKGLLALLLYCEARRPARRDVDGRFVPLHAQDWRLWDAEAVGEAERTLTAAAAHATLGRFQLEAAIQSVHVQRAVTGVVNWPALEMLYALHSDLTRTLGAAVAYAAVIAEAGRPDDALAALDGLSDRARDHQPYWAARARALELAGRRAEANLAYGVAAGLAEDAAVRDFLLGRRVLATP